MPKIVECVPNFSEGRNLKKIKKIFQAALRQAQGEPARVFGLEYNKDHNRMLFTIVGAPSDVLASVFAAIKTATQLIDMNKHHGEHPRIGATDVVPFVPVAGVSLDDCVLLADKLARKVAKELKVPVYLYEAAAKKPENKSLADIRKGEYEGLKIKLRKPDYGPDKLHPTAGAIVIGARKYLIAFNVNLNTADVSVAKKIAAKVRGKGGGLSGVKALGFKVGGLAQVSMNLTDFEKTNFDAAFAAVAREAEKFGVEIKGSEIYGMIPLEALVKAVKNSFKAMTFKSDQVLEKRIYENQRSKD